MKKTAKDHIRDLLAAAPKPIRKGQLEDSLRLRSGTYGDTTARRLREMTESGEVVKETDTEGITRYSLAPKSNVA